MKRRLLDQARREIERIRLEEGSRRVGYEYNFLYPAEFESMTGIKPKGWPKCPSCSSGLSRESSSASKVVVWKCNKCGWRKEKSE